MKRGSHFVVSIGIIVVLSIILIIFQPQLLKYGQQQIYSENKLLEAGRSFVFLKNNPKFDLLLMQNYPRKTNFLLYNSQSEDYKSIDLPAFLCEAGVNDDVSNLYQDPLTKSIYTVLYCNTNEYHLVEITFGRAGISFSTNLIYHHPAWDAIIAQAPLVLDSVQVMYHVDKEQEESLLIHKDADGVILNVSRAMDASFGEDYHGGISKTHILAQVAEILKKETGIILSSQDVYHLIHYSGFLTYYRENRIRFHKDGNRGFLPARILGTLDANDDGIRDFLIYIEGDRYISSTLLCIDQKTGDALWKQTFSGKLRDEFSLEDIDGDGKEEILLSFFSHGGEKSYDYLNEPSLGSNFQPCFCILHRNGTLLENQAGPCILYGDEGCYQYKFCWLPERKTVVLGLHSGFDKTEKHITLFFPLSGQREVLDVTYSNIISMQIVDNKALELFDANGTTLRKISLDNALGNSGYKKIKLPFRITGILPEKIFVKNQNYYVSTPSLALIDTHLKKCIPLKYRAIGKPKINRNRLFSIVPNYGEFYLNVVTILPNCRCNSLVVVVFFLELLIFLFACIFVQHVNVPLSTGDSSYFVLYSLCNRIFYWQLRGKLRSFYRLPKHLSFDRNVAMKIFDDVAQKYRLVYDKKFLVMRFYVYEITSNDEMIILQRISHDAKNQVILLKLMTEQFQQNNGFDEHPEWKSFVDDVEKTVNELSDGMKTLSQFSHINRLYTEPVILQDMLNNSLLKFSNHPFFSLIDMEIEEKEIELFADKTMFDIAIKNLLSNALEAIDSKGWIHLTVASKHENCVLKIENPCDSSRISKENLMSIGYSTKEGGSGLGLPISRTIIERHGGRFAVDFSQEVFGVTLQMPLRNEAKHRLLKPNCIILGF